MGLSKSLLQARWTGGIIGREEYFAEAFAYAVKGRGVFYDIIQYGDETMALIKELIQ